MFRPCVVGESKIEADVSGQKEKAETWKDFLPLDLIHKTETWLKCVGSFYHSFFHACALLQSMNCPNVNSAIL